MLNRPNTESPIQAELQKWSSVLPNSGCSIGSKISPVNAAIYV